jgi:hypothetical protein
MSFLTKFTDQQLAEEIERRKKIATIPPQPLSNPDWAPLQSTILYGHNESVRNGYVDDDLEHYVFEAAMTAVFGQRYWEWRRAHTL